jgi:Ner family transcriptional regulator
MDDPASTSSRSGSDWHPADILAALKKRGRSLAGLSIANGYHPTAAGKALKRPWPAMEAIIARELELPPQTIWPSRYDAEGQPLGRASRA